MFTEEFWCICKSLYLFTFLKVSEGKMLMALSTISVAGRRGSQDVLCLVVVMLEGWASGRLPKHCGEGLVPVCQGQEPRAPSLSDTSQVLHALGRVLPSSQQIPLCAERFGDGSVSGKPLLTIWGMAHSCPGAGLCSGLHM